MPSAEEIAEVVGFEKYNKLVASVPNVLELGRLLFWQEAALEKVRKALDCEVPQTAEDFAELFSSLGPLYATAGEKLVAARRDGEVNTIRELLQRDPDLIQEQGSFLVCGAAADDQVAVLEILASFGADIINAACSRGSPLDMAVENGALAATRWLLDHGVSVDGTGSTPPVWTAVACGNIEMTTLLAERGGDLSVCLGDPPRNLLQLAVRSRKNDIAAFLRSRGLGGERTEDRHTTTVERTDAELGEGCLDLRKDVNAILRFVRDAIERFATRCPSENATGFHIFFAKQNGIVEISFSNKPSFNPFYDGPDDLYVEYLELPHWQRHYERSFKTEVSTICLDGKQFRTDPDHAEIDVAGPHGGRRAQRAIADMFVDLLTKGRENGLFDRLPMADGCLMSVQDDDEWCWPWESEFGTVNQVRSDRR